MCSVGHFPFGMLAGHQSVLGNGGAKPTKESQTWKSLNSGHSRSQRFEGPGEMHKVKRKT